MFVGCWNPNDRLKAPPIWLCEEGLNDGEPGSIPFPRPTLETRACLPLTHSRWWRNPAAFAGRALSAWTLWAGLDGSRGVVRRSESVLGVFGGLSRPR